MKNKKEIRRQHDQKFKKSFQTKKYESIKNKILRDIKIFFEKEKKEDY